jgi:curved DNA-binding protein CbpA
VTKLTDENPYDILGLDRDADKKSIRMAAFGRKSRRKVRGKGKRRLRQAYDVLRSSEERLIVDALMPDFRDEFGPDEFTEDHFNKVADTPDWLAYLDPATIHEQDLQALIEATVRQTFTEVSVPNKEPNLLSNFDGLGDFMESWLG